MFAFKALLYRPSSIALLLFSVFLSYYLIAALNFPSLFNIDARYNQAATSYIAEHKKIPVVTAETNGVLFTELGTTRSLRPPFTFIVSALVSSSFSDIVENKEIRQRLGSALLGALTISFIFLGFYLALGHMGLALFGAIAIGVMPKFVFLASCNNDDVGAIFSASVLFSSVLALEKYGTKTSVLFFLAIALGLVLQTKYTAWLLLPILSLYCLYLVKADIRKIIRLSPFLLLAVIAGGGWWIVFNMFHYGVTDPSALNYAAKLQYSLSNIEPNQQGYLSNGVGLTELLANHDGFLVKSYKSFIGYLEWLELEVGWPTYLFYSLIFLTGVATSFFRIRAKFSSLISLETICILLLVTQFAFYLHHNLIRDIQPQARYALPIIMPLMYLFLAALARLPSSTLVVRFKQKTWQCQSVVTFSMIGACLALNASVMAHHITPSYSQASFHTRLDNSTLLSVNEVARGSSVNALKYTVSNSELSLRRSDTGLAALTLNPSVCDRLPAIALISMDVNSLTDGGFYLRVDRRNSQHFEHLYWSRVPAGKSTASFVISAKDCSGLRLTLGKGVHQLTISNIRISELRINRHGKPI